MSNLPSANHDVSGLATTGRPSQGSAPIIMFSGVARPQEAF